MKFLAHLSFIAAAWGVAVPVLEDRASEKVSYDGYKVYRVSGARDARVDYHSALEAVSAIELSHRHELSEEASRLEVAIAPENVDAFNALGVEAELLSEDLGAEIAAEGVLGEYPEPVDAERAVPNLTWFDSYHPFADHVRFWGDLQAAFPDNSELFTVGTTFQGRTIQGIHLWGSGGKDSQQAIHFHGNVHAREWITSMVAEYLTYQIITGYGNDPIVTSALDSYDFYIIPVVNPDGFVYTQTTDRLWRKNRQTRTNTTSVGTDINRNWSAGFGGGGSSPNPSSETFSGFAPFDAPETRALSNFALELKAQNPGGVKLYIDWHSYSQVILLSYGYTCDDFPENYDRQYEIAEGLAAAIARPYGTEFEYGSGCLVLYQSSGNGRDYFTDVIGTEYGWGIELRDTQYGFLLPPDQILPSGIEIWEGLLYLFPNL